MPKFEFPKNYKFSSDDGPKQKKEDDPRFFYPGQLGDKESITLRPCGDFNTGHMIHGFKYFAHETPGDESSKKIVKHFPTFPPSYEEDICYKWGHGKGKKLKNEKTGEMEAAEDKDYPKDFVAMVACCKERKGIVVATLDKKSVRDAWEAALLDEDSQVLDSGLHNWQLKITKTGEGLNTRYAAAIAFKKPTATEEKGWAEVKDSIWLHSIYHGADPFDGRPANAKPEGLPPTSRDELGQDHETTSMPSDGW